MVFSGEVVNAIAVAGVLAAQAVTHGLAQPRPLDSPWTDKPTAFVARRATQ
jgi:ADP-ribose pyrophosphatase